MPRGFSFIPGTRIPSMSTGGGINARVIGLRGTVRGINVGIAKIKGYTEAGLYMAAAYLREDMDRTPPMIPVDTGNLRSSWYVTRASSHTPEHPAVETGFSANYAVYVHEMTQPPYGIVNWKRPGSGPKFLEKALQRNKNQILSIIADQAKLATI